MDHPDFGAIYYPLSSLRYKVGSLNKNSDEGTLEDFAKLLGENKLSEVEPELLCQKLKGNICQEIDKNNYFEDLNVTGSGEILKELGHTTITQELKDVFVDPHVKQYTLDLEFEGNECKVVEKEEPVYTKEGMEALEKTLEKWIEEVYGLSRPIDNSVDSLWDDDDEDDTETFPTTHIKRKIFGSIEATKTNTIKERLLSLSKLTNLGDIIENIIKREND